MNYRHFVLSALFAFGVVTPGQAADIAAGKAMAGAVCAACHGANGISVAPWIPNLAGQKEAYLANQLKAYKSGKRKHLMMNPIAEQVSAAGIANVAAYFASLPGAAKSTEKSKPLANFIAKRITLPANLSGFTHYMTFNHKGRKQLRKVYANRVALEAAKAGRQLPDGSVIVVEAFKAKLGPDKKPIVGADGFYVSVGRAGFTAMERQAGWGDDFPDLIRNGNWHYGVFKADRSVRPGVNQATCLACHKPLANDSYLFSLKALQEVARK